MSSSGKSSKSDENVAERIARIQEDWSQYSHEAPKITYKNKSGYFMSEKRLAHFESSLAKIEGHLDDPEAVEVLKKEILEAREYNTRAGQIIDQIKQELEKSQASCKKQSEMVDELKTQAAISNSENVGRISHLKSQITNLEHQVADAKKVEVNKFDSDAAIAHKETLDSLRVEIARLTTEKEALYQKSKDFHTRIEEAKRTEARYQEQTSFLKKQLGSSQHQQQLADFDVPKADWDVSKDSIASWLSPKAVSILKQLNDSVLDDYKDQAYILLNAFKEGNSKMSKGLVGLLRIIISWCKQVPYKTRKLIQPWIDTVIGHLKAGSMKTLKFYRDLLKGIVDQHKLAIELAKKQHKQEKPSDPDDQYTWRDLFSVYLLRIKVAPLKTLSNAMFSFTSKVKKGVLRLYSWLTKKQDSIIETMESILVGEHLRGEHSSPSGECALCCHLTGDSSKLDKLHRDVWRKYPQLHSEYAITIVDNDIKDESTPIPPPPPPPGGAPLSAPSKTAPKPKKTVSASFAKAAAALSAKK